MIEVIGKDVVFKGLYLFSVTEASDSKYWVYNEHHETREVLCEYSKAFNHYKEDSIPYATKEEAVTEGLKIWKKFMAELTENINNKKIVYKKKKYYPSPGSMYGA